MKVEQEPKYDVRGGSIINRATGEAIPDDEPIFIFRAKDRTAAHMLRLYVVECENAEHRQAILRRVWDFEQFARNHPDRMKEPDTSHGERAAIEKGASDGA